MVVTRKSMLQAQKMRSYLEIYNNLIEVDVSNFVENRKTADEAHALLINISRKALDDKECKR